MKRMLALTLGFLLLLSSIAVVQAEGTLTECNSLSEAEELSGVDVTGLDTIKGYDENKIFAVKDEMVELHYKRGDDSITVRKAAGKNGVSVDNLSYDKSTSQKVKGCKVSLKGTGKKFFVATWTKGNYSYALISANGQTKKTMTALVKSVINSNAKKQNNSTKPDHDATLVGDDPRTWGPPLK